jgi:hypothetical protein
MCLALRRIDAEMQTYERCGFSTFDLAMAKLDAESSSKLSPSSRSLCIDAESFF